MTFYFGARALKRQGQNIVICKVLGAFISVFGTILPVYSQENLGTTFGLTGNSPALSWPHGASLEALGGIDRLYPNGPEFGLSNTSGGFGMIGSGRISGIGLVQNSVSPMIKEELEQPFTSTRRLTDIFKKEAASSSTLIDTVLSGRFRVGTSHALSERPFQEDTTSLAMPSVDSVLHDQSAGVDSILKGRL